MLFDSPAFFLFLIPVVFLYWRLNHRAQNVFLLLASYFFYGWWDWRFLALMIGSTTADFLIAQKIVPAAQNPHRRKWFIFSLVLNFTILGIFKYFDFFVGSFAGMLDNLGLHHIPLPLIRIILPPGISFYTFQEVAYIVDVYKGRIAASRSFFDYGLFISLLAHRLQDFWRRWHISLSTWLRDYLYIPLGGSRLGERKTVRNLFVTMVLAGLWHGANWTFVIFGAIHGIVLPLERFFSPAKAKPRAGSVPAPPTGFFALWARRILTFNILCLSLAFVRAPPLHAAVEFLAGLSNFAWRPEYASAFFLLCLYSLPLFLIDLHLEATNQEYPFANTSYAFRTALAASAFVALGLFSGSNLNAFVYFQF